MPQVLEVVRSDGNRSTVGLDTQPVTVGRHPSNTVVLDDDRVSRHHCVFELVEQVVRVRDLGSRNGVRVNEERTDQADLSPGDVVRVGRTTFELSPDQAAGDASGASGSGRASRTVADAPAPPAPPIGTSTATEENQALAALAAGVGLAPRQDQDMDTPTRTPRLGDGSADDSGGAEAQARARLLSLVRADGDAGRGVGDVALISSRGQTLHAAGGGKAASQAEVTRSLELFRLLILACVSNRATDIHIEPKQDHSLVRLRVDGTMVQAARLAPPVAGRMTGMVKVLAELDLSRRNTIQEGHCSAELPGRRIDFRVSFSPTMFGQKLVVRVLDPLNAPQKIRDLCMPDWMADTLHRVTRQDAGMVLVCGPTGSGKTTSLYAALRQIDAEQRNVITIEDPVEYQVPGVTQLPIDEDQGNTFNTLLRSVLRQDPDVILLGEVRDPETASTAMQASMTGHLVLSTIHAKDTLSSVFRLLDLGVENYLVASGLNIVLAQRLVRQLCPACKAGKTPTPGQLNRMGRRVDGVQAVYYPVGCERCLGTGYAGRRGVFELLQVTDDIRDVILKRPTIEAIKRALKKTMFTSLREGGYRMVAEGLTSVDEIERVAGVE